MITYVHQTIFGTPDAEVPGNCLQAAIASLLGLPLEDVPHFVGVQVAGGERWSSHLRRWLLERGWQWSAPGTPEPGELHLLVGPSPRGPWDHVALYRDGALVWDPHPDGRGVGQVDAQPWTVRPLDPPLHPAT